MGRRRVAQAQPHLLRPPASLAGVEKLALPLQPSALSSSCIEPNEEG